MPDSSGEPFKYWAFISYSHQDRKWGDWLHKALETYRMPPRLVGRETRIGKIPARLFPIFRDREELPVSADLNTNITLALSRSRFLVVICSPPAARSRWVNQEILMFKRLGRADSILALIIDGEPNASEGKEKFLPEEECFSEALRYAVSEDGTLTAERAEPVAADVRPGRDGRTTAKLKLLAALLGLDFGELSQREEQRRIHRLQVIVAATMSLIFVLAGLGVALYMQRNIALHEKARAEDALREVRQTLSRSDFLQAVQLLDKGRDSETLAYLSRALRTDPANAAATDLTLSLLTQRNWPLPVGSVFRLGEMESAFPDHQAESVFGASTDETWSVWNTLDGSKVGGQTANAGRITYADFSPDGRAVVTAALALETNEAFGQVSDARSGAPTTARFPLKSGELCVKFSPDGKTILSAAGTAVETWDAVTGQKLPLSIEHGDLVNFAVWDPAGKRIATARLFEVLLWDAHNTREPAAAPMKQEALTRILTFSSDGEKLGIALYDNTARLWDLSAGEPISPLMRHDGYINAFCFSPDEKFVLTGSDDTTARIWNAQSGLLAMEPLLHSNAVLAAAFVPKQEQVVTVSGSPGLTAILQRWDIRPGLLRPRSLIHSDQILAATFSADGRVIATACADGSARIWDADTGALLLGPLAHEGEVYGCAFSPNGGTLLTTAGNSAWLWQTTSGKAQDRPISHDGTISHATFSPNGGQVFTTSLDGTARLWNTADAQPAGPPLEHGAEVTFGSFSADGSRVVTAAADGKARIWDPASGRELTKPLQHEDDAVSARFSPDGRRILTASKDKTARLWNADTAEPIGLPMVHAYEVTSAILSADGRFVVTASGEFGTPGAARIWDAQTGKPLLDPLSHKDGVTAVAFDSKHRRIITGSYGGNVQAWDVHTGKPVWLTWQFENFITSAQLSDRRLLIASGNSVFLIDLFDTQSEAPPWLAVLADEVAGLRLNEAGLIEMLTERSIDTLRQRLNRKQGEDDYLRFGRWFLEDRGTRAPSPHDASPSK